MKDLSPPRIAKRPRRPSPLLLVLALYLGASLQGGLPGVPDAMASVTAETRPPSATALATARADMASSPVPTSSGTSPATASGPQAPTVLAQAAPPPDEELPPNADALMRTPRFRGLAAELRCLVCQNQNLLDSHSPLAADLRHEVVRLMSQGMDDGQVKQYLVDRYGEFVLYRPTWSWRNALLWVGPALMLMIGGFMLWRILSRRPAPAWAASGANFDSGVGHGSGLQSGSQTGTDATPGVGSDSGSRPASGARPDSRSGAASASSGEPPEKALTEAEALARVDALLAENDNPRA